jgi:hypothetical protein
MQASVASLFDTFDRAERISMSNLLDEQKVAILKELRHGMPVEPFCVHCPETRKVVLWKIEEIINGLKAKETKTKEPAKGRSGKAPSKGSKK